MARANASLARLRRAPLGEHDFVVSTPEELAPRIPVELREALVREALAKAGFSSASFDAVCSRGGLVRHIPSGIVVSCQQERSQHQNRERAMTMLKSQLYAKRLEEEEAEKAVIEGAKKKIEWGSQIRSYVFQPYTMVNDHRTEIKKTDVHSVMDGELDDFIRGFLLISEEETQE